MLSLANVCHREESYKIGRPSTLPKRLLLTLTLLLTISLQAQEGTLSSGGDAVGADGAISYSIGQTVFNPSVDNKITPGLQQSYLMFPGISYDESVSVYPNPTSGKITVKVNSKNFSDYKIELIQVIGKVLVTVQVSDIETDLQLEPFPSSVYLVKVSRKGWLKVFKIIKD